MAYSHISGLVAQRTSSCDRFAKRLPVHFRPSEAINGLWREGASRWHLRIRLERQQDLHMFIRPLCEHLLAVINLPYTKMMY